MPGELTYRLPTLLFLAVPGAKASIQQLEVAGARVMNDGPDHYPQR